MPGNSQLLQYLVASFRVGLADVTSCFFEDMEGGAPATPSLLRPARCGPAMTEKMIGQAKRTFCWEKIADKVSTKPGGPNMTKLFLFFIVSTLAAMQAAEPQKQPAVGTAAPDFRLTAGDGSQVNLKDYKGKWVVLYFYPKDFTSGCTLEAKNFERDLANYQNAQAIILGVSVDSAQSHKDFCAKEGLNFKLLADPDAKVSTQYGSVMEYQGAKMAARNTFLINPKGEIAKVYTGVKPAAHSEEVLKDLSELKKG
jgi:peroxiredoxin Q/BCP